MSRVDPAPDVQPQGGPLERELRAYLDCGILARGFLRLHCDTCGHDRLPAFSCKGRGLCPSCGGRRMSDTAAHLVDRVLPDFGFAAGEIERLRASKAIA